MRFTFTIPGVAQPVILEGDGLTIEDEQQYWVIWRSTGGNAESNPPVAVGTLIMPDGTTAKGEET